MMDQFNIFNLIRLNEYKYFYNIINIYYIINIYI